MVRRWVRGRQGRPSAIADDRHHLDTGSSNDMLQWHLQRTKECAMDLGLAGQVVVVTGASKGIGLACAMAFAREGAKVVGVSRHLNHLHAAQQELAREGL